MKRLLILSLLIGILCTPAFCDGKFSLVEFKVDKDSIKTIAEMGLPLDCCHKDANEDGTITLHIPVNSKEMEMLKQRRMDFTVIVEDMASHYAARAKEDAKVIAASNKRGIQMDLGSMGGFYKIDEMHSTLDKLHQVHNSKNLIIKKQSIGKSSQGRDIFMIKISDNANVDERDDEPQVLYTALHHAREPAGMMTVIYFMHYLLENYDTNQRVKSIVDNTELYFVPMLNPDGYFSNQSSNPNGGGMQRKNARGVDLNRNYGPQDYWNYPNGGSSTSPWSQTYRGTAPFSETETQVIRNFVKSKNFQVALNYHTYSNLLIYPYGIRNQIAHQQFRDMAVQMTKINRYRYGTAEQLLYAVRGVSDDWYFVQDGSKGMVFAMTPEVGGSGDGFWPRASRIFPLAEENLEANLLLAEYATKIKAMNE